MNGFKPLTLALALAVAAPLQAAPAATDRAAPAHPTQSVERGFETDSGMVLMPTSETGTITVNECTGCRSQRLAVTPATQYFAGSTPLSLAQLKSVLTPGRTILMTVYADLKQPVALRVVAYTQPPTATRR